MFEIMDTPECKLRTRLASFMFSLELLQRNYDELCEAVGIFEKAQNPAFLALGQKWKRKEMLKEVTFRFHNYLASAKSLLDHSRVLYRHLYDRTSVFPEYRSEVKARFADDSLVQFIHGLREMVQHYKLPSVVSRTTISDATFGIQLGLRRDDLMAYPSWKAPARAYLSEQNGDQVGLLSICTPYQTKIVDFYHWFFAKLQVIHSREFATLDQLREEAFQRDLPAIVHQLEHEASRQAESNQISSVRDMLCPFLSLEQQRALKKHEQDEPAWLEAALALLRERIPLSEAAIENLNKIALRAHRAAAG